MEDQAIPDLPTNRGRETHSFVKNSYRRGNNQGQASTTQRQKVGKKKKRLIRKKTPEGRKN